MYRYVKRMSKSWGHLCLKCILSLFHPIGFWQIDTWEYMCVKLCQGAEAEVLISELKLCDSSLMMTSFAEQLTVILSKHQERAIIRVESSSNPPSCEVSGYVFFFFVAYLTQTQMYLVLYESHMFVYVRYCMKILPTPFTTISKTPAIFAPPGCLWIIMWGHFVMDMWSARIKNLITE